MTFAEACEKNFGLGDFTGAGAVVIVGGLLALAVLVWVFFHD